VSWNEGFLESLAFVEILLEILLEHMFKCPV